MKYLLIHDSPEQPELSIIIPAYKEEATIGRTLEQLASHINKNNYPSTEIIVSIGRSPDNTFDKAIAKSDLFERFAIVDDVMPHQKGNVVHAGMMKARGEMCVYMDADLATPLHHLKQTIELLRQNDVVNGQRNINTIHTGHRKYISIIGNALVQSILLPGYKDTQCGFKGFRRNVATDLFQKQRITAWGFDMELLAIAKRMNYQIANQPIPDWHDVEGGSLNEGPKKAFKAAVHTLLDLFRIRYNLTRGIYDQNRS